MRTSKSQGEAARPLELCYRASQRSRVAKKEKVSVSLQRDEPSARNSRRQFAPRFERYRPIVAVMDDQGWRCDLGEQIPHVNVPQERQQLSDHFGRQGFLLQAQVPLHRRSIECAPEHQLSYRQLGHSKV
jgi:hypothetical protein